jgi:glutathione peroxidase
MQKCDVNGDNSHPAYNFLRRETELDAEGGISWNFAKFLVDKNGQPIKSYVPKCHPNDIIPDIEALINGYSSI